MTDLIADLEAGPGSRELSDRVLLELGMRKGIAFPDYWFPKEHPGENGDWDQWETDYAAQHYGLRSGGEPKFPDPTRSVDDALALVPEGWHWRVQNNGLAAIIPEDEDFADYHQAKGNDPAARAICIAVLRARHGQD